MNVFWYEIKSQYKSFLSWTAGILCAFLLFFAAFFGAFMEGQAVVEQALQNLPPAFVAVFGVEIEKIFTFGGFFQFMFLYLCVAGAIMAASTAIAVFAREKRSKCADFLLVKPLHRWEIFLQKLLACFALIVVFNALFLSAVLSYAAAAQEGVDLRQVLLAASSLFFTQLVFTAIAVLYAVLAKKVRSVSGAAMAIGFGGFLISALRSLTEEEAIRLVSPLEYFSPGDVFFGGGFEAKYVWIAAAVFVGCLVAALLSYCRSDAHAV